jgi:hypothetical protein
MLAENYFSHFDKTGHLGLADLVRVKLINAIMIMELDAKGMFF